MVLALCAVMAGIAGCRHAEPEAQLRGQIQALQEAIEQRDTGEVMSQVAQDFAGPGGMDREALRNLVRLRFLGSTRVGTTLGPLAVTLQGDHATVRCRAVLTGGTGRLLPDQAGAYEVTTGWRLVEGEWKLYVAQWESAGTF